MKIISKKSDIIKFAHSEKNLGFVPTMGSLHLGHVSLIKKSIKQCDKTIVSIFINKPQFNNQSDFRRYPRILKKDKFTLKKLKIDYLYLPTMKQIYPNGINKNIRIDPFGKRLCGRFRPKHFEAVADVVDRFIKIIKPKKIYFGQKDMQQLKIIDAFVKKNHPKTKVIGCKTIREKNGTAYSSRNFLLTLKEKKTASEIYKYLINKKNHLIRKKIPLGKIKEKIFKLGATKIDYIEILNINNIIKPYKKNIKNKIFIAYYLNATRLIDNI